VKLLKQKKVIDEFEKPTKVFKEKRISFWEKIKKLF